MIKKKVIIIAVAFLLVSTGAYSAKVYYFDREKVKPVETTAVEVDKLVEVVEADKESYKEVGENAVEKLGDVSDDEKKVAMENAIYDAILQKEGKAIMSSIDITNEEAIIQLQKETFPKISKVYVVSKKEEPEPGDEHAVDKHEDGEVVNQNYYVYEGDRSLEGVDLKKAFPNAIKIEERDATEADNIDDAKRTIAARELVKIITAKTEKVMGNVE